MADVVFPQIKQLQAELKTFKASIRRRYMRTAFRAAAKVGADALKQLVPRGPTGNLRRSIAVEATPLVGKAGFRKGRRKIDSSLGAQGGQHGGLLEFGTKRRRTKGRFASTFAVQSRKAGNMRIIQSTNGIRTARPPYPKSFFASAKAGSTVDLKKMPVGGRLGAPPIATAFRRSQGAIGAKLSEQVRTAFDRASRDLADKFPPRMQ